MASRYPHKVEIVGSNPTSAIDNWVDSLGDGENATPCHIPKIVKIRQRVSGYGFSGVAGYSVRPVC